MQRRIRQWIGNKLMPRPADPLFVWRELKTSRCDLLRIATPHGKFWVTPEDQAISARLFAGGGFDVEQFEQIAALVRSEWPTGEKPVFVDVGANLGTHTIYALKSGLFARALCFEPDRRNFELLEMNLRENGYGAQATAFNLALGAENGEADFELAADNFGDHRIRLASGEGRDLFSERSRGVVKTTVRRLDEVLAESQLDGSQCFLHLDVQGFEAFVLAGAAAVLPACPMMFSELWPYGLNRNRSWATYRELVSRHFSGFYDLRPHAAGPPRLQAIGELSRLFEEFEPGGGAADVLFVRT